MVGLVIGRWLARKIKGVVTSDGSKLKPLAAHESLRLPTNYKCPPYRGLTREITLPLPLCGVTSAQGWRRYPPKRLFANDR